MNNNEKPTPSVTPTPHSDHASSGVDELLATLLQDESANDASGFRAFQVLTVSALQQTEVPMPVGLSERIAVRIAQENAPAVPISQPAQPQPTAWQQLVALFRPAPMRYGMGALGTACALGIATFFLRPTPPVVTVAQEGNHPNMLSTTLPTTVPTDKPEIKFVAKVATPAPFVPEASLATPQPTMPDMAMTSPETPTETPTESSLETPSTINSTPAPKFTKSLTVATENPRKTNLLTEKHNPVIEPSAPLRSTPAPIIESTPEPNLPKATNVATAEKFPPSDLSATPGTTVEIPKAEPKTEPGRNTLASNTGEGSEGIAEPNTTKALDKAAWFTPIEKKSFPGQKQNMGIMGAPIPSRGEIASRSGDSRNKDAR
jgi:hypothetical protein